MWRFAIMFQIGMVAIGVVLIVIGANAGVVAPVLLGVLFIVIAIAGIIFSRRSLRELRK